MHTRALGRWHFSDQRRSCILHSTGPRNAGKLTLHNERFIAIVDKYYPSWREARPELNDSPPTAETWNE